MSKVAIQGNASGTGVFTLASPNSNTDRTLTLPDEAGTILTSGGAIDVNASAPDDSVIINASGIFSCLATQSASSNGYVKLPSGIYIQWGVAGASTGGTTSNFPVTFPNAAWSMVAVNNNQNNPPAPLVSIISLSQFTLNVSAGSPQCYYIAIGN